MSAPRIDVPVRVTPAAPVVGEQIVVETDTYRLVGVVDEVHEDGRIVAHLLPSLDPAVDYLLWDDES